MEKELRLTDKVDLLYDEFSEKNKKKLKIPRKAKVSKGRIKKGWVGILRIDENNVITAEKQKIQDSTYLSKEETYHATDGREILLWEGKYPIIIQPSWKTNPLHIRKGNDTNQTYGMKYIMARMHLDTIKLKNKQAMGLATIIGLAIAAYVGYSLLTGGA